MKEDILQLIDKKKNEIEHYKGVLDRYGSGRWMSMGRRRLEDLEIELAALLELQEIEKINNENLLHNIERISGEDEGHQR